MNALLLALHAGFNIGWRIVLVVGALALFTLWGMRFDWSGGHLGHSVSGIHAHEEAVLREWAAADGESGEGAVRENLP